MLISPNPGPPPARPAPSRTSGPSEAADRFEPAAGREPLTVDPRLARILADAGSPYLEAAAERARVESYYAGVHLGEPAQAFDTLNALLTTSHRPVGYKPRQFLYPWADLQPSLRLKSVYAADPVTMDAPARGNKRHAITGMLTALLAGPADAPALASRIALLESKGDLNCEHVVPKIWFNEEAVPSGDLHHLFTSDALTNLERTNRRLGEVDRDQAQPAHSGEGWKEPEGGRFEPAGGKGEMARATLYFLVRYPGRIGDAPGEYTAEDLPMLLRWHRDNPVTLHERHRNQEIEKIQGNRNPFIDHPEWVDRVDFTRGLAS